MYAARCWLIVRCLLSIFFFHQLRLIVVEFCFVFCFDPGHCNHFQVARMSMISVFVCRPFSFLIRLPQVVAAILLIVAFVLHTLCEVNCDFFLTKLFLCFILFLLALQLLPVVKALLESCQRLLWRCSESLEIIWVVRWRLFFFSWCQVIDCGPVIKTLLESHWRSLQRCSKLPEIVQVVGWRMFIFSWCQVINGGHPQSLIRH